MKSILPPLYKKLLLLAIVIGPFYWLVFTEDGQRRTDLALLHLMGQAQIGLAVEHLQPTMTETDIRALFPDLELQCGAGGAPFGDRLCMARLGAFNQIPARAISLHLQGDQLRALRVDYRRGYHEPMRAQLERRIGAPQVGEALTWPVSGGVLLMPAERPKNDAEAALFWFSTQAMAAR
jgi:hypothetical protein